MHAPPVETASTTTETAPETPTSVTVASDAEIEAGVRVVMDAVPLATRHGVARAALRAGIRLLIEHPMRIVELLRDGRGRPATPDASGKDDSR
jgi:hypothetical protein